MGKTGTLNWRSFSSLLLFKIYLLINFLRDHSAQMKLVHSHNPFFWRCANRRWFSVKNALRAYLEWTTETKQEKIPFQMKKLLLTCSRQNYFLCRLQRMIVWLAKFEDFKFSSHFIITQHLNIFPFILVVHLEKIYTFFKCDF